MKIDDHFFALAEQSPNMIFINVRGRVVYANRRCGDVMGYTQDELTSPGFNFMVLIDPEYHAIVQEYFARHGRGEEVDPLEYRIVTKSGQRLNAVISTKLIRYEGESAILGIVTDVSDYVALQNRLREEILTQRELLRIAGVIVIILKPDGVVRFVNERGTAVLGFPSDDMVGKVWVESVVPDEHRNRMRVVISQMAQGRVEGHECFDCPVLDSDGRILLIEWHAAVLRDAAGAVSGILWSGLDITEERRMMERLRESESRYRYFFEHAPVGIYRTTPDGRILGANPAVVEMLGYTNLSELTARNVTENFHSDTPRTRFLAALERDGEVRGFESKWVRKDGSIIHVRENAIAVRDMAGKTAYYEGTVEDVTNPIVLRESLNSVMRMEVLITDISTRFVNMQCDELDDEINDALKALGEHMGVDRAYVFQFAEDFSRMSNTHEWTAGGVSAEIGNLQNLPLSRFPWIMTAIMDGRVVSVPRVADLPPEAVAEKVEFEREKISSLCLVPLVCRGKAAGFMGFDSVRAERPWSEEMISQLRVVGEILASGLERRRMEDELFYRIALERLIMSISTQFVDIEPHEVDAAITDALGRIGRFVDVDRTCIYRLSEDGQRARETHGWAVPGVAPVAGDREIPCESLPWSVQRIQSGQVFKAATLFDLGDDAGEERQAMQRLGIKSLLCLPLMGGGRSTGVLSLSCETKNHEWPEEVVSLMRIVGEIFASALQKKETLVALDNERRLVKALLDNVPDHIYFKDTRSRFIRMNRSQADRFGLLNPEDAVGRSDRDYFSEEHAQQAFEDEQNIIRTGQPILGKEEKETWPDGTVSWVSTTKMPLLSERGEIVGTFGISRDVTQHKLAEDALERERSLLRMLIDNLPNVYVFIKDRQSRFVVTNAAHYSLLGCRELAEVLGKTDYDFFERNLAERYMADEQTIMESGQARLNYEETAIGPDGSSRWLLTSKMPLHDRNGKITGLLGISTDITTIKESERERRQVEARMQHAQRLESLGVLAGGIAHDFNNLLMGILGHSGLALAELTEETPLRDNVKQIEAIALRAAELTNQMLAYSGKSKFVTKVFSLTNLVKETTRLLEVSIPKSTRVEYNLADHMTSMEGDAAQIRQVVMNLVTNASDAIGTGGGTIRIKTGVRDCAPADLATSYLGGDMPPGRYTFVEVADTGCGMDEKTIARIFDPFFTTKVKGRGLGLSAVLGIVKAHRGVLKVYSEVGKGTDFRVLFPVSAKAESVATPSGADTGAWRGTGTVLVVDDDEIVRTVTRQILLKTGFNVALAVDGSTAVEQARKHVTTLAAVVMDVTLPGETVENVIAKVREVTKSVPLILISGYNEEHATRSVPAGAYQGFLQKPYDSLTFLRMLKEVVTKK